MCKVRHSAPFLKWAGGKRQLLHELMPRVPSTFRRYFEPFLGGGALYFALRAAGRIPDDGPKPVLADSCAELVMTYEAVRDEVELVIEALSKYQNDSTDYYAARAVDWRKMPQHEAAARMIYLNRVGFNGLYRVNQDGGFNVPFGRYANPTICNTEGLRLASEALKPALILSTGFEQSLDMVNEGDFVYADPPYRPQPGAAGFREYQAGGFSDEQQVELARRLKDAAGKGARVLASNSWQEETLKWYEGFKCERIEARRTITRKGEDRGKRVSELLVSL